MRLSSKQLRSPSTEISAPPRFLLKDQNALEDPDYPVLFNGIAWWPLPDKPNTEGWRVLMEKTCTPLLKTREFARAADPKGSQPVVEMVGKNASGRLVKIESTTPNERGLAFSPAEQAGEIMSCTLSRPRVTENP